MIPVLVPIHDSDVKPRFAELQIPNDLHCKPEGSEFLAVRVAEVIRAALPTKP